MHRPIIFVTEPPVRRRKRVAQACTSCHMSKRRCDGGSPCYNCHLAHKTCIYSDGGRKGLPRGQKHVSSPSVVASPGETSHSSETFGIRAEDQAMLPSVVFEQRFGVDPRLFSELLKLFFIHCSPHDAMFHSSTFTADVAAGRVPSFLIKAMLALAAPFSSYLSIQVSSSPPKKWQVGARFAEEALIELVDPISGTIRYTTHKGLELEIAQAFCILYAHSITSRQETPQGFRQGRLLHDALELLVRLNVPDWDIIDSTGRAQMDKNYPSEDVATPSLTQRQRRECFRRTLWVVHYYNILACATSLKDMRFHELDVKMFLPVDEGLFEFGMETPSSDENSPPLIRSTILPPLSPTSIQSQTGQLITYSADCVASSSKTPSILCPGKICTSEFGHLLRLVIIYGKVMAALGRVRDHIQGDRGASGRPRTGPDGEEIGKTYVNCLLSLQQWDVSLPQRLKLNDANMKMHVSNFQRNVGSGSWSWVLMHGLAECCVLVLHEILDELRLRPMTPHPLPQRRVAYENLIKILNNAGTSSRSHLSSGLILFHLGPPLLRVTPESIKQTINSDARVRQFFQEYEQNFGISPKDLCSLEFRLRWIHQASEASPFNIGVDLKKRQALPLQPPPLENPISPSKTTPSSSHIVLTGCTAPEYHSDQLLPLHAQSPERVHGNSSRNHPLVTVAATKDNRALPSMRMLAERQHSLFDRSLSLTLPPFLMSHDVNERSLHRKEASTIESSTDREFRDASPVAGRSWRPPKGMPWLQDAIG